MTDIGGVYHYQGNADLALNYIRRAIEVLERLPGKQLERAQGQMRELDVRYSQLQLEISKLAKPSLVDSRVRKELKMIPLSPERTLYLKEPN